MAPLWNVSTSSTITRTRIGGIMTILYAISVCSVTAISSEEENDVANKIVNLDFSFWTCHTPGRMLRSCTGGRSNGKCKRNVTGCRDIILSSTVAASALSRIIISTTPSWLYNVRCSTPWSMSIIRFASVTGCEHSVLVSIDSSDTMVGAMCKNVPSASYHSSTNGCCTK